MPAAVHPSGLTASDADAHFKLLAQQSPPSSDTSRLPQSTIEGVIMAMLMLTYIPIDDAAACRLRDAWPDIWRWAQVLFVQFVDQRHYNPPERGYLPAVAAVGSCCSSPISAAAVRSTPNLVSVLGRYWLRHEDIAGDELRKGALHACPTYPFHAILDPRTTNEPFHELLAVAGGCHDRIANTTLGHLKYIIARTPFPLQLVRCQLLETHSFSWRAPRAFHAAFLDAGGLTTIIETLIALNAQPRGSDDVLSATGMCFESLVEGVRAENGGVWAARAMDAGLFPAVLGAADNIKRMSASPEDMRFCYALLEEHLPRMLYYRYAVRAAAKALARPEVKKHVRQLKKGQMRDSWAIFFGHAHEKIMANARLETKIKGEGDALCENAKCKTDVDGPALKQCTGCGMAVYCSKECQLAAWNTHKRFCIETRKDLSRGNMTSMTPRDNRFSHWCIEEYVHAREPEIAKQWKDNFPAEPRANIAVLLDLKVIPHRATVLRIADIEDFNTREEMRSCSLDAHDAGRDMWNVAASTTEGVAGWMRLAVLVEPTNAIYTKPQQTVNMTPLLKELEEVLQARERQSPRAR